MRRRTSLIAIITVTLLGACTDQELIARLPPIPAVATQEALPAVQEQLQKLQANVAARPGNARAAAALGVHYLAYQFNEAAEVALRRAVMLAPDNADFAYFHAEARLRAGDLEGAADSLQALLDIAPDDVIARRRLGQVWLELGKAAGARKALTRVVAAAPDDPYARLALAKALIDLDQPGDAVDELQAALAAAGPFDQAYLALSQAFAALGNPERAAEQRALYSRHRGQRPNIDDPRLAALLPLNISDAPLLEHAARMHAAGRVAEAMQALERAVERNPNAVSTRASLLALYASQGLEAQALEQFAAGRALQPDYAPLYYGLGVLRNRQLLADKAREALTRALELNPDYADALFELARTAQYEGNMAEAEQSLRAAVALSPDSRHMRIALGRLLLAQGAFSAAARELGQAAVPDSQQSPDLWHRAGRAWLEAGDSQEARKAFAAGVASARAQGMAEEQERLQAALAAVDVEGSD